MKYYLDTEFIEDGQTIDLISIGIVSDDGREYYAINTEFDKSKANNWVKKNVIAQLEPRNQNGAAFWKPRSRIKEELLCFVKQPWTDHLQSVGYYQLHQMSLPENLEFWGYYADYDWVALCQLFGTMIDLPRSFPMYCHDLKQWCDELGNPRLPQQKEREHNALADAKWNKQVYNFLEKYSIDCAMERKKICFD